MESGSWYSPIEIRINASVFLGARILIGPASIQSALAVAGARILLLLNYRFALFHLHPS